MGIRSALRPLAAVTALALAVPMVWAQSRPIPKRQVARAIESGRLSNPADVALPVWTTLIDGGDVPWLRVQFDDSELPAGSYLVLRSVADGAVQHLDRDSLAVWGGTSAYFNGSLVELTLVAGPATRDNVIGITGLEVGEWQPGDGADSQCGNTDDRVASQAPHSARLLDIGCTAFLFNEEPCFLTAGHCTTFGTNVMEFNVPMSLPSGTIQHPGPEDQYVIDNTSIESTNGGQGDDWGILRVFPNTETGLTPFQAQGSFVPLAAELPSDEPQIAIYGYGVDSGASNQIQQFSEGPFVEVSGPANEPRVEHRADTQGGNSGSAIERMDTGEVIGIHSHAGCTQSGGANVGTGITHPDLQVAIADVCPAQAAIPCELVARFDARCTADGRLQMGVILFDDSFDGATVSFLVDGVPATTQVVSKRAPLQLFGQSGTGQRTIELVNPPGCFAPVVADCQ